MQAEVATEPQQRGHELQSCPQSRLRKPRCDNRYHDLADGRLPARHGRLRARTRPIRAGPAAPTSRCSSSSTTRRAARTTSCTATRRPRPSCREIIGAQAFPNRHMSMESLYEYGSRAGLWRVLRVFDRRRSAADGLRGRDGAGPQPRGGRRLHRPAATRSPATACAGCSYQLVEPDVEREHMAEAVALLTELTGDAPLGWYTGRDSPQTRRLVVEHGGFLYDSDSYADDLPYWTRVDGTRPPGGAVHAGHQRHEVRLDERIPQRHRLLHLSARRVRRAVRRRRRRARRRCCRSGCTAAWSAARPASRRWSGSSITCSPTTGCGSPAGSTSPGTG